MKLEIRGLKCDNPECGWQDLDIPMDDYEKWLDVPCPLCGWPVLTKEDMRAVKTMLKLRDSKIVKFLDRIGKAFGSKEKRYRGEMDGTGKITFSEAGAEETKATGTEEKR